MHIHIIGIAGTKTAPLAKILSDMGHQITGSDQVKIFPPISTILDNAKIKPNTHTINNDIDLVIVGNVYKYFKNTQDEFEIVKKLKIPYISYTNYLVSNLIKNKSILIAGSYGKTTITGLLSFVFLSLKLDPSFMFGGEPIDGFFPTRFGHSDWSIVEADENHNGLDTQPTFLYYPVKYLILTSAHWEHKDSYKTVEENLAAYKQLIEKVPTDGVIIYNGLDPDIKKILKHSRAKTINYITNKTFKSKLIGEYNQHNISAVYTLCNYLGINQPDVIKAIEKFPGIKRRLEMLGQCKNIIVFDDFAQSAVRTKTALRALKYSFPNYRIRVFFEPRASLLQDKASLNGFDQISKLCYDFVLGKIQFSKTLDKNKRVTARDWQNQIGKKLKYIPIDNDIIEFYHRELKPGDLLIHLSSGGMEGLNTLKTVYNQIKT